MVRDRSLLPDLPANRGSFLSPYIFVMGLAPRYHALGLLTALCSALLCWYSGKADGPPVLDSIIFKSIFVIFGFTMGFRNVRANQRYSDAMKYAAVLYGSWWAIYTSLPREARLRHQVPFLEAIAAAVSYIHRIASSRQYAWYGMVNIDPMSKSEELIDGLKDLQGLDYGTVQRDRSGLMTRRMTHSESWRTTVGWAMRRPGGPGQEEEEEARVPVIARVQLLRALVAIEKDVEKLENWDIEQTRRRGFWWHKGELLDKYNLLLGLALPSVTDRFIAFVEVSLTIFTISFPWGVQVGPIEVNLTKKLMLRLNTGIVLVITTWIVVGVLFTLNAMTRENEDPLSGDENDLDLEKLSAVLAVSVAAWELEPEQAAPASLGSSFRVDAGAAGLLGGDPEGYLFAVSEGGSERVDSASDSEGAATAARAESLLLEHRG